MRINGPSTYHAATTQTEIAHISIEIEEYGHLQRSKGTRLRNLVGDGGLEPPTSRV
uniref:Uncharacterized protein n=1 Tax=uncultured Chloroflexi bacterium HF0200_09I09 TaxID=710736 RepID=E0XU90_9CHLR|nr:hypothetical protein [uncultured Chloroflexi bacterium HF0200_09I09]